MSNIQDLLKSAITNGVVDPARSAFLLAQASTAIDRLEARLALVEGQRQGAVLVVQQLEARLAEAVDTLRNTGKPVRELLWCLTVWNDHNFTEADLIRKLMLARKGLGLDGVDRVEKANALLAEIDAVTADSAPAVRCTHKFNEWAQCELPAGHDGVHWLTPNSADEVQR